MSDYVDALQEQEPQENNSLNLIVPGMGRKSLVSSTASPTTIEPTQHTTEDDSGLAADISVPISEPPIYVCGDGNAPSCEDLLLESGDQGARKDSNGQEKPQDGDPLDRALQEVPKLDAHIKQLKKEKKESKEKYHKKIEELESAQKKDKLELQHLRECIANLEKTLEEERCEKAELKRELEKERKKVDDKEKQVLHLENKLLETKLESVQKDNSYKDQLRQAERERDKVKVELAERKQREEEHKRREEEQKRRDAERMNRILLQKIKQLESSTM